MSAAAWERDWILSRTLRAVGGDLVSVCNLENPLKVMISRGRTNLAFDYAFFVLLRSLCEAALSDGNVDGALISAYLHQVGLHLDRAGLDLEAASILNRACELRTRYTLFNASSRRAAFFYQKAINICLIHEKTHFVFEQTPPIRQHWLTIADANLAYIGHEERSASFFPDDVIREDILKACRLFRSNSALLEEVACDLYALQNAISQELERQPELAALYADGYLVAARLMILCLYMGRTIGKAAALAVLGIQGRRPESATPALENQSFLSEIRLRIQVVVLRALVIRNELGLPPFSHDTPSSISPVDADRLPFERLIMSLQLELEACRQDNSLFRAIALAKGVRKFGLSTKAFDNVPLANLYLENYWS